MPQTREHFQICRLLGMPRAWWSFSKCDAGRGRQPGPGRARGLASSCAALSSRAAPIAARLARRAAGPDELRSALLALAREAPPREPRASCDCPWTGYSACAASAPSPRAPGGRGRSRVGEEVEVLPAGPPLAGRGACRCTGRPWTRVDGGHPCRRQPGRGGHGRPPPRRRPRARRHARRHLDARRRARGSLFARAAASRSRTRPGCASTWRAPRSWPGSGCSRRRASSRAPSCSPSSVSRGRRSRGAATCSCCVRYSPASTIGGARVLDPLPPKRRGASAARTCAPLRPPELPPRPGRGAPHRGSGVSGLAASDAGRAPGGSREAVAQALAGEPASWPWRGGIPPSTCRRSGLGALAYASRDARRASTRGSLCVRACRARSFGERFAAARARGSCSKRLVLADRREGRCACAAETACPRRARGEPGPREEEAQAELPGGRADGRSRRGRDRSVSGSGSALEPRRARARGAAAPGDGDLRRVGEGCSSTATTWTSSSDASATVGRPARALDVAAFKELTGLTRKHVIPLLEYLDRERVTRRVAPSAPFL